MADGHCRYRFEKKLGDTLVWYGVCPDCSGSSYRLVQLVGSTVDTIRKMKCDLSVGAGHLLTVRTSLDVCALRGDGLFVGRGEKQYLMGFVMQFSLVRPEIEFL